MVVPGDGLLGVYILPVGVPTVTHVLLVQDVDGARIEGVGAVVGDEADHTKSTRKRLGARSCYCVSSI